MNKINRFAHSPKNTHRRELTRQAGNEQTLPRPSAAAQSHQHEVRQHSTNTCTERSTKTAQQWSRTAGSNVPIQPVCLAHALHGKSAEFWLRLGEPFEALAELENVPYAVRRNGWLHRLDIASRRAARAFEVGSIFQSP
jgi:hypothetical protein